MTRVIFSKYAKLELDDAVNFYELEFEGLGQVFRGEVNRSIKRITRYPEAWSIERGDIRKCLLYKFPYKLLYVYREGSHI